MTEIRFHKDVGDRWKTAGRVEDADAVPRVGETVRASPGWHFGDAVVSDVEWSFGSDRTVAHVYIEEHD